MHSHHILTLSENALGGNDYIIGDIHGDAASFSENIRRLNPNDRLFLVGDLTDRGSDSAGVIRVIKLYQASYPDRLYIVRGNHEDSCLRTISLLEKSGDRFSQIPYSADNKASLEKWILHSKELTSEHAELKNLKNHLKDGGDWLVRLIREELLSGDITLKSQDDPTFAFNKFVYGPNSLVRFMKELYETLPTVIFVEGKKPFYVVHADMPVSDEALQERIHKQSGLDASELRYAVYAREPKEDARSNTRTLIREDLRSNESIISYSGHNIVTYLKSAIIRENANAVNIDVASYKTNVSLRVNHTQASCEYVGVNVQVALDKFQNLQSLSEKLNAHLASQDQQYKKVNESELVPLIKLRMKFPNKLLDKLGNNKKVEPLSPSKRSPNCIDNKRQRSDSRPDMHLGENGLGTPNKLHPSNLFSERVSPKKLKFQDDDNSENGYTGSQDSVHSLSRTNTSN